MSERIRLTREELEEIQNLNNKLEEITFQMGHLEIRKLKIDAERTKLENDLNELSNKDQQFSIEIVNKYGEGKIDFTTGEFIKNQK